MMLCRQSTSPFKLICIAKHIVLRHAINGAETLLEWFPRLKSYPLLPFNTYQNVLIAALDQFGQSP